MFDKFEMIDDMIKKIDALADARGLNRCISLIELAQQLRALSEGLKKDDAATAEKVELLETQLKAATAPEAKDGETVVGGEKYNIDMTEVSGDGDHPAE